MPIWQCPQAHRKIFMDKVTWTTEGFADFEKQLLELANGFRADLVARNTLTKAAKVAMQPVLNTAIRLAPYDENNVSGIHLKETIKLTARIPNDSDRKSVYVNDTDAVIGIVSAKKSAVSLSQEFGNARTAAQPFLIPAISMNKELVVENLRKELAVLIPAYAKKLMRLKGKKDA